VSPLEALYNDALAKPAAPAAFGANSATSLADMLSSGSGLKSPAKVSKTSLSQPFSSTMLRPTAFHPSAETRRPKNDFVNVHAQLSSFAG